MIGVSKTDVASTNITDNISRNEAPRFNSLSEESEEVPCTEEKVHQIQIWTEIRPSLGAIEDMMSSRVKEKVNLKNNESNSGVGKQLPPTEEARTVKGASEDDSDEEFYDLERTESDTTQELVSSTQSFSSPALESLPPWKEELECLVQGGVPMALRGEVH